MPITINGTGTITGLSAGAIASNDIASLAATKLTGTVPDANAPSGSVVQVVSTTKTDTFSTGTTEAWVDISGLSVTITPSSSSNKVLVTWDVCFSGNNGAVGYFLRLVRNSTAISIGNAAGNRTRATAGISPSNVDSYGGGSSSVSFLDSPSSTSATTYKVQLWQISGTQSIFINNSWNDGDAFDRARWVSAITAMEITG
jgi:hypothetical protein